MPEQDTHSRDVPPSAHGTEGDAASAPGPDVPEVVTEKAPSGLLPVMLRFFVVPLILVGASLAVFAGLGSLIARGDARSTDLVDRIARGGKNDRWQAAMELSNRVASGEVDLLSDERLVAAIAESFVRAREEGDDPRIVRYLSRFLAVCPGQGVRSVLEDALTDGDPDVRLYAVEAVARHANAASLGAITARLSDTDSGVRTMAAWAVPEVAVKGDDRIREEAAGALLRALHDPVDDVQWNAALGLARMGRPGGEDVLWALLHPDYVRSRLTAPAGATASLLGSGGTDPATPAEREATILRNALSAVFLLGDRSMLEGVRTLADGHVNPGVRDFAMKTRDALEKAVAARGAVPQRTWTPVASTTAAGGDGTSKE